MKTIFLTGTNIWEAYRANRYEEIQVLFLSQSAIVITDKQINIKEIIRRSGYIQSCGQFIFLSKWEKLNTDFIIDKIKCFCHTENNWYRTVFYTKSENNITNKLEYLLIDDKRYHIGNSSFNTASDKIIRELDLTQNELKLDFKEEYIFLLIEKIKVKDSSYLCDLYEDRDVVDFCVCYLSEFKKDNPIHEMDELKELKPFWAGIFTTPHRLMNAMLNLAKVNEDSIVLDPFCHTGTLPIEASQIGCKKIIASDICGTDGAKDNFNFLCGGANQYNGIIKKITEHISNPTLTEKFQKIIANNTKLNDQGLPEVKDISVSTISDDLSERLYFYILRRYNMEISRGAELKCKSAPEYVNSYLTGKCKNLENDEMTPGLFMFGKQLELFEENYYTTNEPIVAINDSNSNCFIDSHYKSKRVGYINKSKEKELLFLKNDICDMSDYYNITDSSIDAIITDPPYGYGEGLNKEKIEKIYTALFTKAIKWLKPFGCLIFCALDKVKTGRTENLLFTENIIEIINNIAKKNNVYFINNDILMTSKQNSGIYYWKSKYALNRSIISLQIIKNKKS